MTKYYAVIGGTGQAIRIANHFGIEVVNLGDEETLAKVRKYLAIKPN